MAAKRRAGTFTKVERSVTSAANKALKAADEYVVEPVKKLVGMDTKKRSTKKSSTSKSRKRSPVERAKANPGSTPRSVTTSGKSKSSPTSRSGGVTRRRAGTPGSH